MLSAGERESERKKMRLYKYYAVQINVVKGCMTAVLIHATFDHAYLDSRVHVYELLPK